MPPLSKRGHGISRSAGTSLIELLIATAIGLFLVAGALTLYTHMRGLEQHANKITELQENAAFALDVIGDDLRMANYWGLHNAPERLVSDTAPAIYCRGTDISAWALQPDKPLELNGPLLPCATPSNRGDRLTTRHVSARSQLPDARYIQLHTDYRWGYFHADIAPDTTGLLSPENFTLVVNSYFLNDATASNVAELRRWSLGSHHKMYNELIMPNIADLQIEWGENVSGMWVWHKNTYALPSLARVHITAADWLAGQRVEHTTTRIFRLRNTTTPATTPYTNSTATRTEPSQAL